MKIKSIYLLPVAFLIGCGGDANNSSESDKPSDEENGRAVLEATYIEGELPSQFNFDVAADSGCEDCIQTSNLELDAGGALMSFVWSENEEVWEEEFIDTMIMLSEDNYDLIFSSGDVYRFYFVDGTRWILESDELKIKYYLDAIDNGLLSDDEYYERLEILSEFPDQITDRETIKELLVKLDLASYQEEDPDYQIRDIHLDEETGKYYYDPCYDLTGWSFFVLEGDFDYLEIMDADQPSFTYSYQDSYGHILDDFNRIENGYEFRNRGSEENDAWRGLVLTRSGFWVYQVIDEGEYRYMTTNKVVEQLEHLDSDCPEEEY